LSVESLGVTATQLRTRPVGFVLSALNGLLMSTYLLFHLSIVFSQLRPTM
jgi:hypothetical protein